MHVLLAATIAMGLAVSSPAHARTARCVVAVEGRVLMNGPCDFQPEGRDGSFSLVAVNPQAWLMPDVGTLSLRVMKPGVAEIFVVGERASRWGPARRSKTKKACWVGSRGDFRICAY
jgi:hypothetical protein